MKAEHVVFHSSGRSSAYVTRETSVSRPRGVGLALGCRDMGGLPSAADPGNPQHAEALPICHGPDVNNVLALNI